MLVKPMKNKEKYKTPKVSDEMLTSSIEHDIKTRFENDATKKCISKSMVSIVVSALTLCVSVCFDIQ